jgi:hypothetical protein
MKIMEKIKVMWNKFVDSIPKCVNRNKELSNI